jgi:propionate CoA-transferase
MGIREELMALRLEDRFTYDAREDLFFVNLEGHQVKRENDISAIEDIVENVLRPVGKRVPVIVNYDNFYISPDLVEDYTDMVKRLVDTYYAGVTRYTTSTFLRMKIGDALAKRDVAPHIYESQAEARKVLKTI